MENQNISQIILRFFNSLVGERPARRGGTTRPDKRKNPVS